jgi:phage gp36-like protein
VPALLKKIAIDMAVYFLESRRRAPTEERRQNYEDAIAFLKDISKGTASLGLPEEPDVPVSGKPQISGNERIFTRKSLKDF